MMQETDYGIWSPQEGGFRKTCQVCKRVFVGRKNRLYCCGRCRSRRNNDLAAKAKKENEKYTGAYLRNHEILKRLLEDEDGFFAEVSMDTLKAHGFDELGPTTRFQHHGDLWHRVKDIAYLPVEEGMVQIEKILK